MGQKQSKSTTATAQTNMSSDSPVKETLPADLSSLEEYQLKKRRPGCTGMFWRSDPTGKTSLGSNNHWPRDGASLRGTVVQAKGEKWLLVRYVKQAGKKDWKSAPVGAAMPFEYNNHYYLER